MANFTLFYNSKQVFCKLLLFTALIFCITKIPAQATLNFSDDFEGINNWVLVNGTQTNQWRVGSAISTGLGTKSLYISNNNGTTNQYAVNSASIVHAYRDITIPPGTTNANVAFDWRSNGDALVIIVGLAYVDYLRVWLVPSNYNPTAGTEISTSSSRIMLGHFVQQGTFTRYSSTQNLTNFAGTTMKLVFEWVNDGSNGNQPPAAIDNVSLTAAYCAVNPTVPNATDRIVNASITNSLGTTYSNATPNGNSGYLYTNNLPALDLVRGSTTNTISLTFGTGSTANAQYSAAWIDFNGNGLFEATESVAVAQTAATVNGTATYVFTVPTTASIGQTRIRLRGGSNSAYTSSDACSQTLYGDTEDYNVNIVDPSVVTNYTWTGNVNSSWQMASNWTPSGIPSVFDNVTIPSGVNNLNITDSRAVGNVAFAGNLNMAANSNLVIRGNVSYTSNATANLNCASKIEIRSSTAQTIPPFNYGSLDATGGNHTLPSAGTVGICNAFTPGAGSFIVTGSTVNYFSPTAANSFVLSPFTYHNLTVSSPATFTFAQGSTVNVLGNYSQTIGNVNLTNYTSGTNTLNINGDMTITGGVFNMNANATAGAMSNVNLKGDLTVNGGKLDATNATATLKNFNFNGTGNGTSASQIQSVNILSADADNNRRISFAAQPGSYVQLSRDMNIGLNSRFSVEAGAVLDFGFTGTVANNLTGVGSFINQVGSYLKISSPQGISAVREDQIGNVRTTAARDYRTATYHYIGKANQVTGNGIGTANDGKAVIVELDNNSLILSPSTSFGINNTANATINAGGGGILDIRRGRLEETDVNFITGGTAASNSANLKMAAGTVYKITKASTGTSDAEYVPRFYNLNLTGGEVELASAGNQTIRNSTGYQNLLLSNAGTKTLAGTTTVNNLTRVTGGTLRVPLSLNNVPPIALTAKKGLQNTGGNVIFENNALLLQDSDAVNIGAIQLQRVASGINNLADRMDYIYWSSPVSAQGLQAFSPGTPASGIYQYNESNDYFYAVDLISEPVFVPAKGYAFRAESTVANGASKTYNFTGIPHNGDININISRSPDTGTNGATVHGYNLVGNPYPSNINFNELYLGNTSQIWNTAYFWTNNNFTPFQMGSNYVPNNYAIYNGTGGNSATRAATGSGITDIPNGIVKVGQGFIVQKKTFGTAPLQFKNAYSATNVLRTATNGTFFEKNEQPKNRFWLTLTSPHELINSLLIGYIPGASNQYDPDYDAELMVVGSDSFFSVLGARKLAVQGKATSFSQDDVVPLGIHAFGAGTYTIRLETTEGIFKNGQSIYLRDRLLNKSVNLSKHLTYTFRAVPGSYEGRFEIVYKEAGMLGTDSASEKDFTVYRNGDGYTLSSSKNLGRIDVYDASGKLIESVDAQNQKTYNLEALSWPSGLYIIKAENSGELRTTKVMK